MNTYQHNPAKIAEVSGKVLWLLLLATKYNILKIKKSDGSAVEGVYQGCHWVMNDRHRHACVVRLDTPDNDWGASIDASEIEEVEGLQKVNLCEGS